MIILDMEVESRAISTAPLETECENEWRGNARITENIHRKVEEIINRINKASVLQTIFCGKIPPSQPSSRSKAVATSSKCLSIPKEHRPFIMTLTITVIMNCGDRETLCTSSISKTTRRHNWTLWGARIISEPVTLIEEGTREWFCLRVQQLLNHGLY